MKLKTLPLSNLQHFTKQKCLVPLEFFPACVPGTFAKCLTSFGLYICRIFPTEFKNCCFIDESVRANEHFRNSSSEKWLEKVECVGGRLQSAASATILIQVNVNLFEKFNQQQQISMDYLISTVRYLLQPFIFINDCTISSDDFFEFGITAMTISLDNCAMGCHSIDNDTILHISDVQLQNMRSIIPKFYSYGMEEAQRALQTLIETSKLSKPQWRIKPSCNVLISGPSGSGKSTLCDAFIADKKLNCFTIESSTIFEQYPGATEEAIRKVFSNAINFVSFFKPKQHTVILIEDIHLICSSNKNNNENSARICAQLISLLDKLYSSTGHSFKIMVLATTSEIEKIDAVIKQPGRFDQEVIIDILSQESRSKLFKAFWNESFLSKNAAYQLTEEMASQVVSQSQGFVIADMALLVRKIEQAVVQSKNPNLAKIVTDTLKMSKSTSLQVANVSVHKPQIAFDAVGGIDCLKRILEVSVLGALKNPKAFQKFGLKLPKGILLYGPPGCAKTTIAQCLATEANMTFITTSSAEVYSPFVGCAEKFISKIFDAARKNSPCLIFLDEIDSLVGKRTVDSKSDVQTRILSTLLTEMDGIIDVANQILVVAATNRPDMVDHALMRPGRFDKLIHIPAPNFAARQAILLVCSKRMPFAADVNIEELALKTENFSGADLCNLCNEAALSALSCDLDADFITFANFEEVLSTKKSSLTESQIKWYHNFEREFLS